MIYLYSILLLFISLYITYIIYFRSDLSSNMTKLCAEAIIDAREKHKLELDMSMVSLEDVNLILQKLHNESTGDIDSYSKLYGAYIGQVIINQYADGIWVRNHPEIGRNTLPIKFSNNSYASPVVWATNHLLNGEDDNILFKVINWKNSHNC